MSSRHLESSETRPSLALSPDIVTRSGRNLIESATTLGSRLSPSSSFQCSSPMWT